MRPHVRVNFEGLDFLEVGFNLPGLYANGNVLNLQNARANDGPNKQYFYNLNENEVLNSWNLAFHHIIPRAVINNIIENNIEELRTNWAGEYLYNNQVITDINDDNYDEDDLIEAFVWAPGNLVLGPVGQRRSDDPGNEREPILRNPHFLGNVPDDDDPATVLTYLNNCMTIYPGACHLNQNEVHNNNFYFTGDLNGFNQLWRNYDGDEPNLAWRWRCNNDVPYPNMNELFRNYNL
ncbi:MAG: hypothetical protein ACRBFS_24595 [Aureispira sp.]